MIKITVSPPGKDKFCCVIYPEKDKIEANLKIPYDLLEDPLICRRCTSGKTLNHCNLLEALIPVLVYFSDLLSYEHVFIEYHEDNYTASFQDTGQRAGFILCIYTMFYSSCEFFRKFRPILKFYRANITYEIFMHLILTTALIKRQIDLNETHSYVDLFSEVKNLTVEIKERLLFIFQDAKLFQDKDAAVNALNIFFSLNDLSAENLKKYYSDLVSEIDGIPMFGEGDGV